jgi:prepilin-type N-terminal cleavage/methylation domain-containing protein
MKPRRAPSRGFTLIELLVVIAIILLVASLTIPSIADIFSSGSDVQSYQMLDSLLRAARARALEKQTFVGVHVQPGDGAVDRPNSSFACVVERDPETGLFGRAAGFEPIQFPGNIAFGEIKDDRHTVEDGGQFNLQNPEIFVTLTFVFSPEGKLVRSIDGRKIMFDTSDKLFSGATSLWKSNWKYGSKIDETGATAVTMFNLQFFNNAGGHHERNAYMNDKGVFLGVNLYTGQLFPRE